MYISSVGLFCQKRGEIIFSSELLREDIEKILCRNLEICFVHMSD